MFEGFKKNLEIERELIQKIKSEKDQSKQNSYLNQLKLLNKTVPELLKKTSPVKTISSQPINVIPVTYSKENGSVFVLANDKNLFENEIKKFKNTPNKIKEFESPVVKPSFIKKISNRMFRGMAEKHLSSFIGLSDNIKKANLNILPSTYLAITFFFTFLSIFLGIFIYATLILINIQFWIYFWIIFLLPIIVLLGFYYYPKSEADVVEKNILYELPFATIHMSAISGSDIEPTKIFQIIANSKEYKTIGKEMQKILVLIKLYGYDLVTALKSVASRTSNQKFSELLGGMATNISGGGELKNYLDKKAESYLHDYKLERKKYIDLAGTFMDIYISILIAAPMILMLMFIIMDVVGLGFEGYTITSLMIISIIGIIIVNIIFLIAINLKQPRV